jgi:pyruvate,orthophosphate dikinase
VLDSDLAETIGSRRFRVKEGADPVPSVDETVAAAKAELREATGLPWIDRLGPESFLIKTTEQRWVEYGQFKDVLQSGSRERPVELRLKVVLTRTETSPEDVHGMLHAKGILTARGGATAHASVVARGLGLPCVVGCEALRVNYDEATFTLGVSPFAQGDAISIDGATGEVFGGLIPAVEADFEKEAELRTVLEWADETTAPFMVWANADYPRDAERARALGARGVGLCRTEHMFFETERLPIVHEMILNAVASRAKADEGARTRYLAALGTLEQFQKSDFAAIFRAMAGLPVVIRLIDPPLHEFLPKYEDLLVELTTLRLKGGDPSVIAEKERLLHAVEETREANPMLGLRGCRLGIMYPEITEMQVRAILEAAIEVKRAGVDVHPEIMIPLVGHVNELRNQREALEAVAKAVMGRAGLPVDYKFGTMIEVPRGALTADEIAKYAEFFSFGTNDLTQMTFGYSRDDAEGKFLMKYVEDGILPYNPFQTLDGIPEKGGEPRGVAKLMQIAVERGRKARPGLEVGICGEHGGDPASVAFCHSLGLNYVSCSPFRVPVARLAAGRTAAGHRAAVARDK